MGAAAAEVGRARQRGRQGRRQVGGFGARPQVRQLLRRHGAGQPPLQVGAEDQGDLVTLQFAVHREQRLAARRLLAADERPVGQVVERLPHLGLDEAALVLDDDDLLQARGELAQAPRFDRRDATELQDADAVAVERCFVQPQQVERQAQVAVGLAGRDQAQAVAGAGATDAVEAVGMDVLQGGHGALSEDLALHLEPYAAAAAGYRDASGTVGRRFRDSAEPVAASEADRGLRPPSATLVTTFSAVHRPENRDRAMPCRPSSRTSAGSPG